MFSWECAKTRCVRDQSRDRTAPPESKDPCSQEQTPKIPPTRRAKHNNGEPLAATTTPFPRMGGDLAAFANICTWAAPARQGLTWKQQSAPALLISRCSSVVRMVPLNRAHFSCPPACGLAEGRGRESSFQFQHFYSSSL